MPRTTADAAVTTRAARERLAVRIEPHWRGVESGVALGYRRGERGGVWLARVLLPTKGSYDKERLGRADDVLPANGVTVLDFRQAQVMAVAWAARKRRVAAGLEAEPDKASSKPYTVADALADYINDLERRRGKRSADATRTKADAHIVPTLGTLPVARLTRDKVRAWHVALAAAPFRNRAAQPTDADGTRRRKASANRVLTALKAACNHARTEGRIAAADDAWRLVKPFGKTDVPKVRYMTDAEAVRLVNGCQRDFRDLVTAALLTGCRYGELTAVRAGDLDSQAGTLHIPSSNSKSGKARHVILTDEGRAFFGRMALSKQADRLLFTRNAVEKQATRTMPAVLRRVEWKQSDQFRAIAAACTAARIEPAISFHVLRHTYATRLASNAAPLMVIAAQLGHSDTRMTERHYAHAAPSYVADTVRASFSNLGIGTELPAALDTKGKPPAAVVPIRRSKRAA